MYLEFRESFRRLDRPHVFFDCDVPSVGTITVMLSIRGRKSLVKRKFLSSDRMPASSEFSVSRPSSNNLNTVDIQRNRSQVRHNTS